MEESNKHSFNFDFNEKDNAYTVLEADDVIDYLKNNVENESNNTDDVENDENRKAFLKSLSPEYKAEMIMETIMKTTGRVFYGHARRIELRRLIREAKKGKLDKYFK
jgi:hypothetical protein